ncbi:MAG: hypothetical protein LC723_06255 [Actinobacteria bacterium]|nr:hypothetical protein [Actinomycetota bacterium]
MRADKKLEELSRRLEELKTEIAVADEQLVHYSEVLDRAEVDLAVEADPLSRRAHNEAKADFDRHTHQRGLLLREVADIRKKQDALLDEML